MNKWKVSIDWYEMLEEFDFELEDWIGELHPAEVCLFSEYIDLYEKDLDEFFETLIHRKKQQMRVNKIANLPKKKNVFDEKNEKIAEFYKDCKVVDILYQLHVLSQVTSYVVEKNIAEYRIGKFINDEIVPFDKDDVHDHTIKFTFKDEEVKVSIQAIIMFISINEQLHKHDEKRLINCGCDVKEALFAYNYASILQKPSYIEYIATQIGNLPSFFMTVMVAFSKSFRFLQDLHEDADEELQEEIVSKHSELNQICVKDMHKCYSAYLKDKIKKFTEREKSFQKKLSDMAQKLDKQKGQLEKAEEKNNELKQELKDRESYEVTISKHEKALEDKVKELDALLDKERKQADAMEKAHKHEVKMLERNLEQAKDENAQLKQNVSQLQNTLNAERKAVPQVEELSFEKWLEKGRQFLPTLTEDEVKKLRDFIAFAEGIMDEEKPKLDLATNRIGYVRVDADGISVNFGNNIFHQLPPYPAPVYLSDEQFIEVTEDLQFVRAFNAYFTEGPADFAISCFSLVEKRHGEPYAKVNGQTVPIKFKENALILEGQVISINNRNELVSYYKQRYVTLDEILPSIRMKNHKPYYVTHALANGYVLRDLDGKESFVALEEHLQEHSMIVIGDNMKVTLNNEKGNMYKLSSFYNDRKMFGSVSDIDDVYVQKSNGEYVMLKDVPANVELDLGDMVWVDEFNRFIKKIEEEGYVSTATIEQKLLNSGKKVVRNSSDDKVVVEKDKELLIIGNVRISERYKKFFGEYGYEVEVVDGTGPFEKISQACSRHDLILYSTAFTSHKNSGKLSKDVNKKPILCDSTSPSVMLRALLDHSLVKA